MNPKKLCALGIAFVVVAPALAQYQAPPPYQQPPPQAPAYQPPPPAYQQPPAYQAPPAYQQPQAPVYQPPQAPAYQQPPAPGYQAPPAYQQPQPPAYQQPPQAPYQAPPAYQTPPPPAYPPPPPAYQPYQTPSASPAAPSTAQSSRGINYHPWRMQIEGGYTITQGDTVKTILNDGGNAGLGITWFPTAVLPLGFRVDGSYTSHSQTLHSLAQASQSTGQNIADGYTDIYGGDVDAEIDLHLGQHSREYFFGGVGWYRERTTLKSVTYQQGTVCFFFCYPGYYPVYSTVQQSTTAWLNSWNAGIGFEFPLSDPATFFVDARFLRIKQPANGGYWDFIPIRVGIRF